MPQFSSHGTLSRFRRLYAKTSTTVHSSLVCCLALHIVAREDTNAKFPRNTGATRSSVRPISLATSAKSLHSLMLLSMCEDAAYEKSRLPIIPNPSRKTQTIAAAIADAFSAASERKPDNK